MNDHQQGQSGRSSGLAAVEGIVDRVKYLDKTSGFCVLETTIDQQPSLLVGEFGRQIEKGAKFSARGRWTDDSKHGRQFRFDLLELRAPTTEEQVVARLTTYPGLGERTAASIVEQFGERTWDVLDRSIDDLLHIPGIGTKALAKIKAHHHRQSGPVASIKNRLLDAGASPSLAKLIHKEFGDQGVRVLEDQPYLVAARVDRFSFRLAEKLARSTGLDPELEERLDAGVIQALREQRSDGHSGMPPGELEVAATDLLGVRRPAVADAVERLVGRGALEYRAELLQLAGVARTEARVARGILALARPVRAVWHAAIPTHLSEGQQDAVAAVARSGVTVLTGGPGTGKSTAVAAVLQVAGQAGCEVHLCAPTGRAAKRLSEATGAPAATIHRMLRPCPGGFHFDEKNKLPVGLVVVDEVSMVDLELADALLAALTPEHRLLLVGDADQLPSVGPGNVLADVLEAADGGANITVVRLDQIYRQIEGSPIIANAHRMLSGEPPISDDPSLGSQGQFFILSAATQDQAQQKIAKMASVRIPEAYGFEPTHEVQILSPTHGGPTGTEAFNSRLQQLYAGRHADSFWCAGGRFCVGDRVMQMRNDYERNIFNGDIGTVEEFDETFLTVNFDGAAKKYKRFDLKWLSLAYAMTIHKSQGGEFPAVIIPVPSNSRMLTRNLLYTAITRAKKLCILVGHREAIVRAVQTVASRRWTRLSHRLTHHE